MYQNMCVLCTDIVVSAPFEEETPANGAEGAVYIFLGSGDSYIIQPYEEVERGEGGRGGGGEGEGEREGVWGEGGEGGE